MCGRFCPVRHRAGNRSRTWKAAADVTSAATLQCLELDHPAIGVGLSPPLDAGEGVVELLGDGADGAAVDHHMYTYIYSFRDGRDHGCGAGAPGLVQIAVFGGVKEFLGGDEPLFHLIAPMAEQLQTGAAGDAGKH